MAFAPHAAATGINDVEDFVQQVYAHKAEQGFAAGVTRRVANLIALPVLAVLSVGVTGFVKWGALLACDRSSSTCGSVTQFLDGAGPPWTARKVIAIVQLCVFGVWWCMCALHLFPFVKQGRRMQKFYSEVLGIEDQDVFTEPWPSIVTRLWAVSVPSASMVSKGGGDGGIEGMDDNDADNEFLIGPAHRHQQHPREITKFTVSCETFAALVYTRLLRREHYWTALYTVNALRSWKLGSGPLDLSQSVVLFHALDVCCVQGVASPTFVSRGVLPGVLALRRRLWLCAAGLAVLLPFLLPFVACYAVLRHAQDVHAKRVQPRGFSHAAKWQCRQYGELTQCLDARLERAAKHASAYLSCFVQPVVAAVASVVVLVTGFALGVLLVLAVIDEDLLSAVVLGSHNLLWYAGMLGGAVTVGRMLAPSSNPLEGGGPDKAFAKLHAVMHYAEPGWTQCAGGSRTAAAIRHMFPVLAMDTAMEVLRALCAPITIAVLCSDTDRVRNFLNSIRGFSARHTVAGIVCRPAAQALGLQVSAADFLGGPSPSVSPSLGPTGGAFLASSREAHALQQKQHWSSTEFTDLQFAALPPPAKPNGSSRAKAVSATLDDDFLHVV
jgi:hypothetical protein